MERTGERMTRKEGKKKIRDSTKEIRNRKKNIIQKT